MKIYLADLGHNQLTISSDTYPLGVANLATYTESRIKNVSDLEISIVREPEDLKDLIDAAIPDVLALSSYSWNHNLSLSFARYLRERSQDTLTLMGGPNFPLVQSVQEEWMRSMPDIDIAVRGPTYEGERAFLNIIQRYVDVGFRREGVFDQPVAGNLWIDPRTSEFVDGGEVDRITDLDDIPSPYLSGHLDAFLSTGYFPLLQIARGCPFRCTFCNSSVKENSRIYAHSIENVKKDLQYLAERVSADVTLCFADDNFGMYERDEEIADYIGFLQEHYGWPKYIRTTTGKNRADRIIRVMRKAGGALPMTSAVQSMNPVVLENIERSNIKLETYAQIQNELRAQGMQSYGEMILCLPGETKQTFLKGVSDLLDSGVKRVSAHQLMLLHGAPLSNPDSRERFGFRTRFRVVARNIGVYTDEPVIETEEMVVHTNDFSFDDYISARVFHLLLTIYYYEGNFEEAFAFAEAHGVKPFDLVIKLQEMLDSAPQKFRDMVDAFVQESKDELHESPEACIAWAKDHFDTLLSGEDGGNLLSKYSVIGRFYVTNEAIGFLHDAIHQSLADRLGGDESLKALESIRSYLHAVMLAVPFDQTITAESTWTSGFDVESWVGDGYKQPLESYQFDGAVTFHGSVPEKRASLIKLKVDTFGEHPAGLGKFTRSMFARDMRRALVQVT